MNNDAWCEFGELAKFLEKLEASYLLENIEVTEKEIRLSDTFYSRTYQPSIKRQIAAVLAVLGEYQLADNVHRLQWMDLSPRGEKITNSILKKFGFSKHAAV
jgi:hypothetical protein